MPFYTSKDSLKRQERMNKHIEEIKLKRKGQLNTIIIKDEPQKFDQIYNISQITVNEQVSKKFTITQEIIQKSNEIPIHRHQLEERIKVDQAVIDKCIQLKNYNEHEFDNLYIDPTSLQLYQNNIQLERIQPCIVRDYTHFRVRSNDKQNPNTSISFKQLQLGNFN
ncbi:Hypothetical_protein [Hexamita inflata]|uniref:Hypothetical_protein n=1 Tax=Hexamita inflata TaxID=28002 RepID=A0AA86V2M4_9EUKA|nr:Hypothetical protein HINF_LOCUS43068 [Hexamita inflata]